MGAVVGSVVGGVIVFSLFVKGLGQLGTKDPTLLTHLQTDEQKYL